MFRLHIFQWLAEFTYMEYIVRKALGVNLAGELDCCFWFENRCFFLHAQSDNHGPEQSKNSSETASVEMVEHGHTATTCDPLCYYRSPPYPLAPSGSESAPGDRRPAFAGAG